MGDDGSAQRTGRAEWAPSEACAGDLATTLAPGLCEACGGRLSGIRWFRSTWQAGGASTGFAEFELDGEGKREAVVKVPVGPSEYRWTTAMGGWVEGVGAVAGGGGVGVGGNGAGNGGGNGGGGGPTPRVYAAGREVAGYDLAWLVVERLPGLPVSSGLDAGSVMGMLEAAADWYASSVKLRPELPAAKRADWAGLLSRARDGLKSHEVSEAQRWNNAIKSVQKHLGAIERVWEGRPINTWCHGDFHPGNVMRRPGANGTGGRGEGEDGGGRCVLIDLALVHSGHWIEDALYLERLFWGQQERLCGVRPVQDLARLRKQRGLNGTEDHGLLANARRVLMAACVPAFLAHEGHPRYVAAALEILERTLPVVVR